MRTYISVPEFLERNRDPITGSRVIGRDAIYTAIRTGQLPHIRIGRKLLVPSDALDILAAQSTSTATLPDPTASSPAA